MLRFTKMEGLGNDYIYVDLINQQVAEERLSDLAVAVSDRHLGVGADGLIAILPPIDRHHQFRFRMFNADGSEGEMCGNGMRCFARYCYDRGLTRSTRFAVQTLAGTICPEILLDEGGAVAAVRVDMGVPRLKRSQIPMAGPEAEQVVGEALAADGQIYAITAVSMGNPHIIIFCPEVEAIPLERVGPVLERHPFFPRRTNVHFAQVVNDREIRMRSWERGAGITLACGTGACAVLVAAHLGGLAGRQALVHLPGGDLEIGWDGESGHLFMTGPATYICDGVFLRASS